MSSDATDEVVVPFEKMKIFGLLLLGGLLAAVAIWVGLLPAHATRYPVLLLRIIGVVGGAFFGLLSLFYLVRLFDNGPGLIVDREGIVDRTTYTCVGRVPWVDIQGLRMGGRGLSKYLVVDVLDPDKFFNHGNMLQRTLRAINGLYVGSPIWLSANSLSVGFADMVALVEKGRRRAGAGAQP